MVASRGCAVVESSTYTDLIRLANLVPSGRFALMRERLHIRMLSGGSVAISSRVIGSAGGDRTAIDLRFSKLDSHCTDYRCLRHC